MALKITSQIGTDRGITSEAYVRIADYQVSKYGSANFRIELYQSQDDVVVPGTYPALNMSGTGPARNQQIGESLYVAMTKEVTETVTVTRMVPVEVEEETPGVPDEDGNITTTTVTRTRTEMQEQDVEETITKTVPDMSGAEGVDIFAFGYGKLKAKLQDLFGEANVVDC
jgi:hypothetical protein